MAISYVSQEMVTVCIVLVLVVIAWTLDSFLNPAIYSTDLNMSATMAAKDIDNSLYLRDNLFADESLYRFYTPLYRWIIYQMWQLTGAFETGLAWLVPVVLSLYLGGMFILLRRVSGNTWLALALSVASAHYHNTMGAGVWGVGGSAELMPRTLFMPAIPLLFWLYLRILEAPNWRTGAVLGFLLGLVTNLHPVSGLHFLLLLLALLMLIHGHRFSGWQTAAAMGGLAVIGAWPVSANYLQNTGQSSAAAVSDFATFSQLVAERYPVYFFPATFFWPMLNIELTRPLLDRMVWFYLGLAVAALAFYLVGRRTWPFLIRWGWLLGGLISLVYGHMIVLFDSTFLFVVVGAYIIYCFWRRNYPQLAGWLITLMGLVVLYAFVGYYLLTSTWQTFEIWALTALLIEYARAARFVYLPVYLLAAMAGAALVTEANTLLKDKINFKSQTSISLVVAIVFALAPGLTDTFAANFWVALLAVIGLTLLAGIIVLSLSSLPPRWVTVMAIAGLIVLLFGPVASVLGVYLSIPARNFLQPDNRLAAPVSGPVEAELYEWVIQNTPVDSLFYGCFGSETMTHFRRKAQRSITHNWKDLAYNVHQRATLLSAYHRFRQLETACQSFDGAIASAHTLQVDYLLVSSTAAADYLSEACFTNQKYAVFTLNLGGCSRLAGK